MALSIKTLIVVLLVSSHGYTQQIYNVGQSGKEYTIKIYRDTYVIIECGMNAIHVEELPRSIVSQVNYLTIEHCELPEDSLQKIIDVLGGKNTTVMTLVHVPLIKREHFVQGTVEEIYIRYSGVASNAFEQQSQFKDVNLYKSSMNLTETSFSGLINLEYLAMTECNIASLPQNLFKDASQLKKLKLPTNLITELTKTTLEGLVSLEVLDLSENQLTSLPDDLLHFTPLLRNLYLDTNPLRELTTNALKGSNLESLIIKDNTVSLALAPRALSGMSRLILVVIENCSIATLPADLLEGSNNVYRLDLTNNHIEDIPPHFFDNKNSLVRLDLNNNRLSVLDPDTFVRLPKLRTLNLKDNAFIGNLNFHDEARVRLDVGERETRSVRRGSRLARAPSFRQDHEAGDDTTVDSTPLLTQ